MAELIKRDATSDDLDALPAHTWAEIIDGELWVLPHPGLGHQQAVGALAIELAPAGRRLDPDGWVILPGVNIKFGRRDVLVPDLAGWRRSRMPQRPDGVYVDLVPDWICEVLSPSNSRFDKGSKREIYAKAGVTHLWFVEPTLRTVDVLALHGKHYQVSSYAEQNDSAALAPFLDVTIDLARLWAR